MAIDNVISLFPQKIVFLLWDPATSKMRYHPSEFSGTMSKELLMRYADEYKEQGKELLHAFIGSDCQMMRYFVELEP